MIVAAGPAGLGLGVEEASAQLSQLEADLESGNAAVLGSYPHLTDMLANDALNPSSGKAGSFSGSCIFSQSLHFFQSCHFSHSSHFFPIEYLFFAPSW